MIIDQKVCKTKVFTKKYTKIAQHFTNKAPKVASKNLVFLKDNKEVHIVKSICRDTNIPICMGFEGISLESLEIGLYGLIPLLLPSGHVRHRLNTASGNL